MNVKTNPKQHLFVRVAFYVDASQTEMGKLGTAVQQFNDTLQFC